MPLVDNQVIGQSYYTHCSTMYFAILKYTTHTHAHTHMHTDKCNTHFYALNINKMHLETFRTRSALFGVNFRPLQKIEAIMGGGQVCSNSNFGNLGVFKILRFLDLDIN